MNLLSSFAAFFAYLLRSLFCKSDGELLGAAEEKVHQYQERDRASDAMEKAPKISNKAELIEKLKDGALCLVFFFSLSACASPSPAVICPKVKEWTRAEQAAMVSEIKKLPENSLIVGAMVDYHNMRQEARACEGIK